MNGGMAMSSYKDYKKRALQNSEVKSEYDALQPEYDIILLIAKLFEYES